MEIRLFSYKHNRFIWNWVAKIIETKYSAFGIRLLGSISAGLVSPIFVSLDDWLSSGYFGK